MTVSTLTLRQTKGARLTTVEMDNNWLYCSDSSNATFAQSGTGAVSIDLQSKTRNIEISAWDYMSAAQKADVAARTATVDIAAAINAAAVAVVAAGGYEVQLPHGKLLVGSKISVPASVILVGHGRGTTIVKGFNGDCFEMASFSGLKAMDIDGNSATYTGRGVIITEGTNLNSGGRQKFFDVRISNTASYNVEYTTDGVGYASMWVQCDFSVPNNDIYCVKLPVDTGTGNRIFIGCNAPSDSIMNLNGSANTNLDGCFSGRSSSGSLWCLGFASTSQQAVISGCRLAGGGQTGTIDGTLHVISGGSIAATGITFASGATKNIVRITPTGAITWTDSSNSTGVNANEFDVNVTSYAPTWTGGTPVISNGTIVGTYVRDGRKVFLSFELNYGSLSTPGVGAWSFSIPFKAGSRRFCGAALIKDASDTFYTATAIIEEDASTVQIYPHGKFAAIQDGVPFTWANGDKLNVTIEYFA